MTTLNRFFAPLFVTGLLIINAPFTQAASDYMYGTNTGSTVVSAPTNHSACVQTRDQKAANAAINIGTGILEIPKNIINVTNDSNIFYGLVGGTFKGMINTGGRIGTGFFDLLTLPWKTKPIPSPVKPWNNFNVDTTYGNLMSMEDCQKPTLQEAEISESTTVHTPAVTPRLPVVKQNQANGYHQQTNQKIDQIFRREMMK
jgi:putative exosortase-associated protein (TIGR04073 family)